MGESMVNDSAGLSEMRSSFSNIQQILSQISGEIDNAMSHAANTNEGNYIKVSSGFIKDTCKVIDIACGNIQNINVFLDRLESHLESYSVRGYHR